jgi:hypothetical protein
MVMWKSREIVSSIGIPHLANGKLQKAIKGKYTVKSALAETAFPASSLSLADQTAP